MTLHWWMHWFWITYFTISVCLCDPISSRLNSDDNANVESDATTTTTARSIVQYNSRLGKSIGIYPKTPSPTIFSTPDPSTKITITFPLPTSSDASDDGSSLQHELAQRIDFKKQTEPVDKPNNTSTLPIKPNTTIVESERIVNQTNVTSVPIKHSENRTLNDSITIIPIKIANVTNLSNATEKSVKNESLNVVDENDDAEISTVRALSLETAVGRRAIDVPIVHEPGAISPDDNPGLDAASVAGICFGTLVIIALAGAISFVLYRRRYLNKPQTLNDKCSNADSSGYIDDSTIRENSEEMYSLDNDSFLNSLEAMTIQNYWTDSVKHTKL